MLCCIILIFHFKSIRKNYTFNKEWFHFYVIDEARDTVLETIDSLPTKEVVKKHVEDVAQNIPSSDYVHGKIDDYVQV